MKVFAGKKILLLVENLSVPFDKRPWREACALKDAGADVFVICPKSEKERSGFEDLQGIGICRYTPKFSKGTSAGYMVEYIWAFLMTMILMHCVWLKLGRIDVIHSANPPDIFWIAGLYFKLFGAKFIFDEHDSSPETYLSRFEKNREEGGFLLKCLMKLQYFSYKYADAIIATNESYREKTIGISRAFASKTFVVRNGPDTRYFKAKNPNKKLKKNFRYMGAYIGIMARQDGVDYIIRAMDFLVHRQNFRELIVYLIGSGDDLPYLKQLVADYGLHEYILFTGRINDERALEILSTADIGLSPDPYNPLNNISTMNKIMEFMCLGKPIVSFDLKEARYSAGEAALYVENNNVEAFAVGILKLLHAKDLCERMKYFSVTRIANTLSWEKQIYNLYNVYEYVFRPAGIKNWSSVRN
ncbi:MAG: glycosyltransferase family 4 protein [Deltaproteobacteria bacterium]|nr:glycosyltransferase family 4 protein [Deltaproteobacteria bacterium]